MNPQEKEIVAFHESGHAIVAESVKHADPVRKISIIPRGVGVYERSVRTGDLRAASSGHVPSGKL